MAGGCTNGTLGARAEGAKFPDRYLKVHGRHTRHSAIVVAASQCAPRKRPAECSPGRRIVGATPKARSHGRG
jgi:hypothetical protein